MTPIQLHIYFPFSYWQERDPRTGAALYRPDAELLRTYLQCLCHEMADMREDYDDCEIEGIRFCGGYLSLLDSEELEKLLAVVHRCFHVKGDCPVSGIFFPGSLDMERFSVYRRHRVSPFLFEAPSLLFRECEKRGYPVTMQALDQTVYFLRNFQADDWGLRLPVGIPDRTENMWRSILGQIYHYHPTYLQFYSIAPETEESPAFEEICGELTAHGYRKIAPLTYSLSDHIPFSLRELLLTDEYVGVGLGAVSQIDGFCVRNVTDMTFYNKNCCEYRSLVQSVTEIPVC